VKPSPFSPARRDAINRAAAAFGALVAGPAVWHNTYAATESDISGQLPRTSPGWLGVWVHIDHQGNVTLICNQAEMGQGVTTALPIMLAEELEVDPSSVRVRMAPPAPEYSNPLFGRQLTGESASVRGMYPVLREAGAQGRDRLLRAAAMRWCVALEAAGPTGRLEMARSIQTHR
jgi:CO/xanthine dehydrogenase Mo-binding subunit